MPGKNATAETDRVIRTSAERRSLEDVSVPLASADQNGKGQTCAWP